MRNNNKVNMRLYDDIHSSYYYILVPLLAYYVIILLLHSRTGTREKIPGIRQVDPGSPIRLTLELQKRATKKGH